MRSDGFLKTKQLLISTNCNQTFKSLVADSKLLKEEIQQHIQVYVFPKICTINSLKYSITIFLPSIFSTLRIAPVHKRPNQLTYITCVALKRHRF